MDINIPKLDEYFEICDYCEKDKSIQDLEIKIYIDVSRPIGKQNSFLCAGCAGKLKKHGYILENE